jgi:hypothetical protein
MLNILQTKNNSSIRGENQVNFSKTTANHMVFTPIIFSVDSPVNYQGSLRVIAGDHPKKLKVKNTLLVLPNYVPASTQIRAS